MIKHYFKKITLKSEYGCLTQKAWGKNLGGKILLMYAYIKPLWQHINNW